MRARPPVPTERIDELVSALRVIYAAARGDEKSECWTIRKWLDDRYIFNEDIGSSGRLIEEVCKEVLTQADGVAVPADEGTP